MDKRGILENMFAHTALGLEEVAALINEQDQSNMAGVLPKEACVANALLNILDEYLRSMPYKAYLQTAWWHARREEALIRAGYSCQLCNTKGAIRHHITGQKLPESGSAILDVHHRTYENRGREQPEDLVVLCRPCHSKFHGKD